jgi:hypothetical protein
MAKDNAETQSALRRRRESSAFLLVLKARRDVTHPRVFCEKRPQAIENKRRRSKKETQEISRGGKPLKD